MTSRSTTRQGPSSRRLRRNLRMRSVITLFPSSFSCPGRWCRKRSGISPRRGGPLPVSCRLPPVRESRCDIRFPESGPRCHCLDWGEPRTAQPATVVPLQYRRLPTRESEETKKARYVVALSRVPHGERGSPVSSPATGLPRQLSGLLSGFLPTGTRQQARAKLGIRDV